MERADPVLMVRSAITAPDLEDVNVIAHVAGGLGTPAVSDGRVAAGPGEVVVDSGLGLDVGDTIVVAARPLEVVGIVHKVSFLFGSPTIFMDLVRPRSCTSAASRWRRPSPCAASPRRRVAGTTSTRTTPSRPTWPGVLARGVKSIDFMKVLLWIVAAGIIGSIVYLSTLERVREFAVFKAVGVTTGALFGGLVIQALALSAIAAHRGHAARPGAGAGVPRQHRAGGWRIRRAGRAGGRGAVLASLLGLRRAVSVDPAMAFGGK